MHVYHIYTYQNRMNHTIEQTEQPARNSLFICVPVSAVIGVLLMYFSYDAFNRHSNALGIACMSVAGLAFMTTCACMYGQCKANRAPTRLNGRILLQITDEATVNAV
jgi:hypothetical protein